jgi:hypothetical protein
VRRGRLEIVTVGTNPNLQLVGSDPLGGTGDLGIFLSIGPASPIAPSQRQLFMLAVKSFNMGQRGRLVGIRQYLTIGTYLPSSGASGPPFYLLERPVVTPTWKFVDGNVEWGIRKVPPFTHFKPNPANAAGVAFEYTQTPALLFESLTPEYLPPYGGLFPGNVLTPELGRFFDIRSCAWCKPSKCDIPFEGPCDIAFMASVQQTNPMTRTSPPVAPPFSTTQGAVPEDAFLQTYSSPTSPVVYIRIAGALIFEMEEQAPTGMPKTYRRPGDGDRLTRDTTEVGDNVMRRSGEDTTEVKACEDGKEPSPKRPASPPHVSQSLGELHEKAIGFGKSPKDSGNGGDGVINRLIRKWRKPGSKAPARHQGLGKIPESKDVPVDPKSKRAINRILQKRKDRNGGTE